MAGNQYILKGIRVVEVASMVLAPAAAGILADFGAEVIKVEVPGGGDIHRVGHKLPGMPVSEIPYAFQVENRNKRSIALNLKDNKGREVLEELVQGADVFITNYRAAALKKLQITYKDFKAINPRIIYACASGYGETGPEAENQGYDAVSYWARSGIEGQIFPVDGWPGPFPYGSGDRPSAMNLLVAILLALYDRERTGKGTKVSTSLLASGAWANATMIQAQLCGARFNEKVPREKSFNFTYLNYMPKDGKLFKLNIHDYKKGWAPFCRAVGRPDLIENPQFATIEVRVNHMSELIAIFDRAIGEHDLAHWSRVFTEHDIPFAPVQSYEDIANDHQMEAADVFVEIDHPRFGKFRTVDSPLKIEGADKVPAGAAPDFGEHTKVILAELGYSEDNIKKMLEVGTVVQQ